VPTSLSAAVRLVIESNRADGYIPSRFITATADGAATNLLEICARLINRGETLEYLESALRRFPTLLTIEDFISQYGSAWGFDQLTIEQASARSRYFDILASGSRYG
jgi:hypothetical protein